MSSAAFLDSSHFDLGEVTVVHEPDINGHIRLEIQGQKCSGPDTIPVMKRTGVVDPKVEELCCHHGYGKYHTLSQKSYSEVLMPVNSEMIHKPRKSSDVLSMVNQRFGYNKTLAGIMPVLFTSSLMRPLMHKFSIQRLTGIHNSIPSSDEEIPMKMLLSIHTQKGDQNVYGINAFVSSSLTAFRRREEEIPIQFSQGEFLVFSVPT